MNELVQRLTKEQEVEASLRPEPRLDLFKAAIDRNYVHIRFTQTKGGTELGVRMDTSACDLTAGDFDKGTGKVKIVGGLILNYVRVRCHAEIDLKTLKGRGRLEIIEEVTPVQLAKERAERANGA
ncbi:MAG: MbtH domain protein [Deltaproteobacteria bacterium RIFOXYB12_FULL_58_9]|nr:MAG: MbtH domain protein [Deltaproteobacteria bacterium RIFOXYB12_FULL_58_9]